MIIRPIRTVGRCLNADPEFRGDIMRCGRGLGDGDRSSVNLVVGDNYIGSVGQLEVTALPVGIAVSGHIRRASADSRRNAVIAVIQRHCFCLGNPDVSVHIHKIGKGKNFISLDGRLTIAIQCSRAVCAASKCAIGESCPSVGICAGFDPDSKVAGFSCAS